MEIPKCEICNRELAVYVASNGNEDFYCCSSDYIEDFPLCRSCLIEHCCSTNCLGCEHSPSDYHKCRFLEMKNFYLNEED